MLNLAEQSQSGSSVNDHIKHYSKELCTVEYLQQRELVEFIHALGNGARIWCKDLKWGYNNVPIHPDHVRYLAFEFDGKWWCYQVLPMGATSCPSSLTDFMEFLKFAIKHVLADILYLSLPREKIHIQVFLEQADLTISQQTVRMSLIDNHLNDLFGGHPLRHAAFKQFEMVDIRLEELGLAAQADKAKGPTQSLDLVGKKL